MRSSYIENNYGKLIEEYIVAWQPSNFVELGILDGYSTLHIANGIKRLSFLRKWNPPKLQAYDLFDDYQFKHGRKEEVEKLLKDNNVNEHVDIIKGDAYKVHENYENVAYDSRGEQLNRGIEFLHIDISNTGNIIKDLINLWHPKIGWRCIILIEGGSEERDNVEWMKKFNMSSIKKELDTNPIISKYYIQGTYYKYPSMTVLLRKWY